MFVRIFAGGVQFVVVMRMLDRGDAKSLPRELCDQVTDQRCLASVLTTDDVDTGNLFHHVGLFVVHLDSCVALVPPVPVGDAALAKPVAHQSRVRSAPLERSP